MLLRTSPIVGRNILGVALRSEASREGRPQRRQTYYVAIHGRAKPLKLSQLRGRRRRASQTAGFRKATPLTMLQADVSVNEQDAGWRAKDRRRVC